MPIWGLLILKDENSVYLELNIFVCLVYNICSVILIKRVFGKRLLPFLFIGPVIYFITTLFALPTDFTIICFSPISICLMTLIITSIFINNFKFDLTKLFLLIAIYMYSFSLQEIWFNRHSSIVNFVAAREGKQIKTNKNLKDFSFQSKISENYLLKSDNKFTLIETWNKSCGPCIHSIEDLKPIINKYSQTLNHVYLYVWMSKKESSTSIYNSTLLERGDNILIDNDNKFCTELGLQEMPYFLLFDKNGVLVDSYAGYSRNHKEAFESRLISMLELAI